MAKESMKAREVKRAKLVAKYAAKRAELLAAGLAEVYQAAPDIARFAEYEQIRENAPQPECAR